MTEQEIEKLREKLGSDYSVKRLNGAITVELVDIWKGVEFAECVEGGKIMTKGKIYPILRTLKYTDGKGISIHDDSGNFVNTLESYFKPSTEATYVEQLKAKAHELYGEINDGDRFDRSDMGFDDQHKNGIVSLSFKGWDYCKKDDKLFFGSICIYQQGKWAKKVDERVKVVPSEIHYPKPDNLDQYVTVELRIIGGLLDSTKSKGAVDELAKCLEDYLNKIP